MSGLNVRYPSSYFISRQQRTTDVLSRGDKPRALLQRIMFTKDLAIMLKLQCVSQSPAKLLKMHGPHTKFQSNRNSHKLLLNVGNGTIILEIWESVLKLNIHIPSHSTPKCIPKRNLSTKRHRKVCLQQHCLYYLETESNPNATYCRMDK